MGDKMGMSIFEQINFCERFSELSNAFQTENRLEKFDQKIVERLMTEISPCFYYDKKERCFCEDVEFANGTVYFRLSLKHAITECMIGASIRKTGERFGGPLPWVLSKIYDSKSTDYVKLMHPRFSSYDELRIIVSRLYDIFEDFSKAVVEAYEGGKI